MKSASVTSSGSVSRFSVRQQSVMGIQIFSRRRLSPWAVNMAARMGFASSYVRVDRASKACKKARLVLLYASSSSSAIVWVSEDYWQCIYIVEYIRLRRARGRTCLHFSSFGTSDQTQLRTAIHILISTIIGKGLPTLRLVTLENYSSFLASLPIFSLSPVS